MDLIIILWNVLCCKMNLVGWTMSKVFKLFHLKGFCDGSNRNISIKLFYGQMNLYSCSQSNMYAWICQKVKNLMILIIKLAHILLGCCLCVLLCIPLVVTLCLASTLRLNTPDPLHGTSNNNQSNLRFTWVKVV
jgi:hypothetical protein